MASYFDRDKKKYVVQENGEKKEFAENPSWMDRLSESFETNQTKAELEALRKRRMKASG